MSLTDVATRQTVQTQDAKEAAQVSVTSNGLLAAADAMTLTVQRVGSSVPIATTNVSIRAISWSQDGQLLAALVSDFPESHVAKTLQIYSSNLDLVGAMPLSDSQSSLALISWSRTGDLIAISTDSAVARQHSYCAFVSWPSLEVQSESDYGDVYLFDSSVAISSKSADSTNITLPSAIYRLSISGGAVAGAERLGTPGVLYGAFQQERLYCVYLSGRGPYDLTGWIDFYSVDGCSAVFSTHSQYSAAPQKSFDLFDPIVVTRVQE